MKPQEAIPILERLQEPEAWEPQISRDAFEALELAIEALEKQIPQKIKMPNACFVCPSCGSRLAGWEECCCWCGQRLRGNTDEV